MWREGMMLGVLAAWWAQAPLAHSAMLEGSYTEAQAAAGKRAYDQSCAECHHPTLRGTGHGLELAGPNFLTKWGGHTTAELIDDICARMPPQAPGSLTAQTCAAITAHVLRVNGAAAGDKALGTDGMLIIGRAVLGKGWDPAKSGNAAASADVGWQTWRGAGSIAGEAEKAQGFMNREVTDFAPVTERMLLDPPAHDWLNWRRTLDGHGYSPLDQVHRGNVGELKLAWVLTMREGSNQVTPLVHDGVMYLTHPGNVVQAIDAANGDLIWEYAYPFPPESKTLGGPTRNIAIYEDKIFFATYDAALVALSARTGRQLWRTAKADYTKGYTHTAGPVIAGGVVISGINGCERFKKEGCFITGHDPDTGKELWRTSTIALPGDPANATWAGLPVHLRAGGDSWIAGSYDATRKLYYIGTSQAKPWVAASRGMSPLDAALYTNSTLALDPTTGRIAWHYQHVPGETLDMETGFERVLVDLDGEALLFTIGKDGILWKLARDSGRFVDFSETLFQNIFEPLDKATGRLVYRKDIVDARIDEAVSACPGIYGGHNWQATAYSPETRALIIPLHQLCVDMIGREVQMVDGFGGYGGESRVYEMPGSNGMLGRLSSWDLRTMTQRWTHTQRAMFLTSVLTTAGKLAFVGDLDRYFNAFDVESGKLLWRVRLGAALHGFPISYAVRGKQYVAVPTGMGVFKLMTASQSPDIYQPQGGNALYVFELGD
jgi:alcohol dehydrogenase (cytochrome c)